MSVRSLAMMTVSFMAISCPTFADAPFDGEMPGDLTGSLTFNSDYVFRGISQTSNGPAVQGSVDWAFSSGFKNTSVYVGTFASNVDFPGTDANMEMDFLAGARGTTIKDIGWDLGFTYYKYFGVPQALDYDYYEFGLALTHDFGPANLKSQVAYSPDFSGDTGKGVYVNGLVGVPLPEGFNAFASIGHQWIEDNGKFGVPDYVNWSVGLSRPIWKFNVTAMYTDTDIGEASCFAKAYGSVCDARGVVTVGLSF